MAYTHAWNDTDPPGSELAKNIDDQIRLLRSEIHERMDDLTQTGWTADPVIPKSAVSGSTRIVPAAAFNTVGGPPDASSFIDDFGLGLHLIGGGPKWAASLSDFVPIGSQITKLEWLVDRNTITTITASLLSLTFSVALTPATEHTMSTAAGGVQIMDSGAIAVTLVVGKSYVLEIDQGATGGQSGKLYAVRVTVA